MIDKKKTKKRKKQKEIMTCHRTEGTRTKAGYLIMSTGATRPVSTRSKPELSLRTSISGNKPYVAKMLFERYFPALIFFKLYSLTDCEVYTK